MASILRSLTILGAILILAAISVLATTANAQTPDPTGEGIPVCPPNRPDPTAEMRRTVGPISVIVPEGRVWALESPEASGFVNVCVEGVGSVRIASDCSEVSRDVTEDARSDILDAIVASCETAASISRVSPTATAQTPNSSDYPPPVCPPDVLGSLPARQVTIAAVTLSLPEGQYFALESLPGSGDVVACHQATAGIKLSGIDCSELARFVTDDNENATLDAIAASCTIDASFTPTPPLPTSTRIPATTTQISPPDTGSAGLR
jgi:hypothetical protein